MPILAVLKTDSDVNDPRTFDVIKAAPDSDPEAIYIRLQFYTTPGVSYKWKDSIDNFNDEVSIDPTQEPRWSEE